jgi:L-2-hydroxyglutarate oxidase
MACWRPRVRAPSAPLLRRFSEERQGPPSGLRAHNQSPGFHRFARRHWRTGLVEFYRDLVRRAYAAQARRYLPELSGADLLPAPAGIRAQAVTRDGKLVDDFLFASSDRVLHVRNAPSPAATSAFAIAEHIADRMN